jgi:hypothetical protein
MKKQSHMLSEAEVLAARERRLEMQHLQAIEGNPLDAEDIAMFEMFERERWSHERCRAFILERARKTSAPQAAE